MSALPAYISQISLESPLEHLKTQKQIVLVFAE